jgi:NitT/TauT family transport system permease protein
MKILRPFEVLTGSAKTIIMLASIGILLGIWGLCSMGDTHLFPTIPQVLAGFSDLWKDGLTVHVFSSLGLFLRATFISIIISLIFCYMSPISLLKPIATVVSKLRYLPLTGIAFYISILINDARSVQVWILVVFMTTFLTTSLLQMLTDIPMEEFDHARTLGCSRWEILWEVVIKGRFDYVIEMVRQNLAMVWVSLVTVESILAAAGGLGFLIKNNDRLGDNGKVIALQIVIIFIGISIDWFLTKLRKLIFRYSNF